MLNLLGWFKIWLSEFGTCNQNLKPSQIIDVNIEMNKMRYKVYVCEKNQKKK